MADLAGDVAALIEEAAAREIMPRFRLLKEGEVEEKSKGDFVTIADREAELWLSPRLEALIPGSIVIGEEAVAADVARLKLIESDETIWTVDPVDGTANFVAGRETFGVMVGLIRGGETIAAWIYLPVSASLAAAELGGGAWWRDEAGTRRLSAGAAPAAARELTGAFNTRFMSADWRDRVEAFAATTAEHRSELCSAVEYTAVARGLKDVVTYHRMMPWDHVPGSLILREAGGVVRDMATGADYAPRTLAGPHLVARDEACWQMVRAAIGGR